MRVGIARFIVVTYHRFSDGKYNAMWFVYTIMISMLLADLWWWRVADVSARKIGTGYRWITGIFMGFTILGLFLLVLARFLRMQAMIMPEVAVEVMFIWHFMVLPVVAIPSFLGWIVCTIRSMWTPKVIENSQVDPSRRAFLAHAITLAPPIITAGLTAKAVIEQDDLVITRTDLALKRLPKELEGTTIALVTDPHIGSFMSDSKYRKIIELTNSLDADLVLQAGDLINSSLLDLPDGIQMLDQFRARRGVYSCQGNHDCIQSRQVFERDTLRANVGMLLDQEQTIQINGKKLQILSPRWIGRTDVSCDIAVKRISPLRDPDAFQVLLTHHPHCFDEAARSQIPLTLAGHTHGGQIALSKHLSFGAISYKYWSGAYQKDESMCYVSNGVGNWFPLRINMPCEIVHLTLRGA